jgi:hypothetical protein
MDFCQENHEKSSVLLKTWTSLKKILRHLDLWDIRNHDPLSHEKLGHLMWKTPIFVLPSFFEEFKMSNSDASPA